MWGLAAGGQDGVRRMLEILRSELDHTLALCGASGAQRLEPQLVVNVP
jgi:4-hydroxymandelate oxidase